MSAIHGQERPIDFSSLGALSHPRRRWIVETLRDDGGLDVAELATRVAAWERDTEAGSIDGGDRERTMVELIHVDLPVLDDAGAIDYDPQQRIVRPSGTTATDAAVHDDVPSSVIDALADWRRRYALTVLAGRTEPMTESALARAVADAEREEAHERVTAEYRQSVQVGLHHCHLPKLDDAGLVEYDSDAREVARTDETDDVVEALVRLDSADAEREDPANWGQGA
jgi:predicted transcriptional regulator